MQKRILLPAEWTAGNMTKIPYNKNLKEEIILGNEIQKMARGEKTKITIISDEYIPNDNRRFMKLYIKEVKELIDDCKSMNDVKILLTLFDKMNYQTGEIIVPNIQLAEELKMDKSLVSKSLKNLLNKGILMLKEGTEKRKTKTYTLNKKYFKYGR